MSRAFDLARSEAVAEEHAARQAAKLVPGSALRVGYDRYGRFSASRYVDGVGIVLTADRPETVAAERPERRPTLPAREYFGRRREDGVKIPETRASAKWHADSDEPAPVPTSLPSAPRQFSRETQCDGKVPYSTKQDAKNAAKLVERHVGSRLGPYRCPWCEAFHIGGRPAVRQAQRDEVGRGSVAS